MKFSRKLSLTALALATTVVGSGGAGAAELEASVDTSDRLETMIEVRQLIEDGRHDEAKALIEEAGFEFHLLCEPHGHDGKREEVKAALEAGDYDSFVAAVEGTPMGEKVTPEIFDRLVEAHKLREAGDHEGAKAIMEELGIERPKFEREGRHFGKMMRSGKLPDDLREQIREKVQERIENGVEA